MKTIEVVAAVIQKDGNVFVTQRGYGEFKDMWEFPGGKVEPHEQNEAALVREIQEELDTLIQVDRFLTTVEYTYPSFHLVMHCYLCSIKAGELTLLEHEAAKWLPVQDIDPTDFLPADILVIEELMKLDRKV